MKNNGGKLFMEKGLIAIAAALCAMAGCVTGIGEDLKNAVIEKIKEKDKNLIAKPESMVANYTMFCAGGVVEQDAGFQVFDGIGVILDGDKVVGNGEVEVA